MPPRALVNYHVTLDKQRKTLFMPEAFRAQVCVHPSIKYEIEHMLQAQLVAMHDSGKSIRSINIEIGFT